MIKLFNKTIKHKNPVDSLRDMQNNADKLGKELQKMSDYGKKLNEVGEQDLNPATLDEILCYLRLHLETYRQISKLSGELGDDLEIILNDLEEK